jgi:hypothetical protein
MTFPTFGIWRRKNPDVMDYKHLLIDGMEGSTEELYQDIEAELAQREVPGLAITREEFAEGGLLSAKRIYLRMRRERLVFDVCSSPFGKGWFYSYRFAEIPVCLMVWELLLVLAFLAVIVLGYITLFGVLWGSVIIGTSLLGLFLLLRHSLSLGFYGLDDFLIRIPVFGIVYEALLRKETYYREDTRAMYVTLVREVIEARIKKSTTEKGFEQRPFVDATPDIHHKLAELLKHPRPTP